MKRLKSASQPATRRPRRMRIPRGITITTEQVIVAVKTITIGEPKPPSSDVIFVACFPFFSPRWPRAGRSEDSWSVTRCSWTQTEDNIPLCRCPISAFKMVLCVSRAAIGSVLVLLVVCVSESHQQLGASVAHLTCNLYPINNTDEWRQSK